MRPLKLVGMAAKTALHGGALFFTMTGGPRVGIGTVRTIHNLGGLYQAQKKYVRAVAEYRRALAIETKLRGPSHFEVARVRSRLGEIFHARGMDKEAEHYHLIAVRDQLLVLGPDLHFGSGGVAPAVSCARAENDGGTGARE